MAKATAEKVQPEITKVEVIKEVPLEKQIEQTLVKNNVTKRVIAAMEEKYGGGKLVLKDATDTENYLIIKEARKDVRKVGILVESLCKTGREDAIRIQKLWLAKEKEVLADIAKIQDPLDAEIKKYDDEKKRLEELEEKRKDEQYNVRQTELIKMGAVFANGCLNINELSIETSSIREADDEIYNETILPLFQRQYEKNEQEKIALQKKKDEEAAELKRQQDALAEQQRVFNEQQAELKKQQEELQRQKEEVRLAEEKRQRDAAKGIYDARVIKVQDLGLQWNFKTAEFAGHGVTFGNDYIQSATDQEFEEKLINAKPVIEKVKMQQELEAEQKRLADIEAAKQKAIKDEQERAAEEQRQKELKAKQNEENRLQEAAKATDKTKWEILVKSLEIVTIPEFKSPLYQGKLKQLLFKMNEIKSL